MVVLVVLLLLLVVALCVAMAVQVLKECVGTPKVIARLSFLGSFNLVTLVTTPRSNPAWMRR